MEKLKVGDKVVRGPDWRSHWDSQGGKDGAIGTITDRDKGVFGGWYRVAWSDVSKAGLPYNYPYEDKDKGIVPVITTHQIDTKLTWTTVSGDDAWITLTFKEDTLNKNIVEVYENTKDAVLVNKHFGNEIHPTFTGLLNLKANKKAYLEEATRLEEEEKKKD